MMCRQLDPRRSPGREKAGPLRRLDPTSPCSPVHHQALCKTVYRRVVTHSKESRAMRLVTQIAPSPTSSFSTHAQQHWFFGRKKRHSFAEAHSMFAKQTTHVRTLPRVLRGKLMHSRSHRAAEAISRSAFATYSSGPAHIRRVMASRSRRWCSSPGTAETQVRWPQRRARFFACFASSSDWVKRTTSDKMTRFEQAGAER